MIDELDRQIKSKEM